MNWFACFGMQIGHIASGDLSFRCGTESFPLNEESFCRKCRPSFVRVTYQELYVFHGVELTFFIFRIASGILYSYLCL